MKLTGFLLAVLLLAGLVSCVKEEISLDNLSTEVGIEREIAMPLLKNSVEFENIAGTAFDSLLINGQDTIKLFLIQDIEYEDTISVSELAEGYTFDYLNIHNTFTNMFPVGLDLRFYLYDSLQSANIDTIYFSGSPDELFLIPAPTDSDGLVIENAVETKKDVIEITGATLDRLMYQATHMVLSITVPSTNSYVKILDHYALDMKLGIEAKGYYETDLDSGN